MFFNFFCVFYFSLTFHALELLAITFRLYQIFLSQNLSVLMVSDERMKDRFMSPCSVGHCLNWVFWISLCQLNFRTLGYLMVFTRTVSQVCLYSSIIVVSRSVFIFILMADTFLVDRVWKYLIEGHLVWQIATKGL